MKRILFSFGLMMLAVLCAFAQGAPLPTGFQDVILGMDLSSVKERLTANPYFNYRGDPDVSMLRPSEVLIECRGAAFIDRAFFQFYEDRLFTIILVLDPEQVDHFSVFTRLVEKYGQPTALSPKETAWESDTVRFSVERPLSVKYVDTPVLQKLRGSAKIEEPFSSEFMREFLDQF